MERDFDSSSKPPAEIMDEAEWRRQLSEKVIVRVHEPIIPLPQGSWLRVSRHGLPALLREIMSYGDHVRLTVEDPVDPHSLRRVDDAVRS